MKIGVVAFPSKHLQDLANNYRKRYDPHYAQITPHITLKDAFDVDEAKVKGISDILQKVSETFGPLKIQTSRVSSFYPITNTIFFKIEPTPQLENLQKAYVRTSTGLLTITYVASGANGRIFELTVLIISTLV